MTPTLSGTASDAAIAVIGVVREQSGRSSRAVRAMRDVFVGIDPSASNTGVVCLGTDGGLIAAGNGRDFFSSQARGDRKTYDVRRHLAQVEGICRFLSGFNVLAIAYEDYSFGSTHRAYTLAEFNGILKSGLLALYERMPFFVAPTANKKFATGYGNAGKEWVLARAVEECPGLAELPKKELTSDVCDAWSLARLAWYVVMPEQAAKLDTGNDLLRTRLEIAAAIRER